MAGVSYPPSPRAIVPTPDTESLFVQIDELRAQKQQHPTWSPEWLRLGAAICALTEAIRRIETEARR